MQKCTSCARAGDEIGHCGSHITCGTAVEIDPKKDVVIRCQVCDITRAVSIPRLMTNRPYQGIDAVCPRGQDKCAAVLVVPKASK